MPTRDRIISDTEKCYETQEHCYADHASGLVWPSGMTRYVLTTRSDGYITVRPNPATGLYRVSTRWDEESRAA